MRSRVCLVWFVHYTTEEEEREGERRAQTTLLSFRIFSIGSVQLDFFFITFVSKRIHSKRRKFGERGEAFDIETSMEKPEGRRRLW